ncbi:MAG TPA: hypothetical protein PL009_14975, partial [Flavipsychrobacter sp.]|nr:hypothetical protein [Flavipsychrobacter sp.]
QELDHHKEQEIIATRHDREVWLRNIAILLLGTGGGIIVHLLNKRRLHHKAQKNVLTQRKALTDKALQYAREELQAFTRTISEKNMLIERMTAELNRDADQLSEDADIAVREGNTDLLLQLQQSILLTDEQWEDFQLLFEQAYPGYLANLNKKHSNLTPAETRYILLLKLRLSQKEMAAMLGISPSSIRIYRHRLRKKLQLGEDANLEELAENI